MQTAGDSDGQWEIATRNNRVRSSAAISTGPHHYYQDDARLPNG
jgi:hypothetical protein